MAMNTAATTAASIRPGTLLRKRGSNCATSRDWVPSPLTARRTSSWAVLRAVVVGLEDFHLANADAAVVEAAAQLFGEEAGQLLGGGIAAAFAERLDLVEVAVVEGRRHLDRGCLQRGEVQHVAGGVERERLGVHQHPVVVPVQRLALVLAEPHLVRRTEPQLLADPIGTHARVNTGLVASRQECFSRINREDRRAREGSRIIEVFASFVLFAVKKKVRRGLRVSAGSPSGPGSACPASRAGRGG